MDCDSTYFSNRDEACEKECGLEECDLQAKDLERILLEKDEHIALLERSILEKDMVISDFERQNHGLIQKIHGFEGTSEVTKKGETEKQVTGDLLGKSDKKRSLPSTLSKSKWDGERLANEASGFHQQLEWQKSGKSLKTLSNKLNEISVISYLNNGDIVKVQKNTQAVPEENITTNGMTKIFEDHLARESYLSSNISEETAGIILESPLKSMSKEQLISHYLRVVGGVRRDKERLLAEKIDEIYRLKRDILRKKVNDKEVCSLRRMLAYMAGKERELKALCESKEMEHSCRETCLLNRIAELENEREEMELKNKSEIDILRNFLEEIIKEKTTALNMVLKECVYLKKQKHSLEEMMQDKDRVLSLVLMEKQDQKQKIALMEKLIGQKENEHEEQQALLQQSLKECYQLKRQNVYIETLLSEKEKALDSAKREQDELRRQLVLLEKAVEQSRHSVDVSLWDLEEAQTEKLMLEKIAQANENTLENILKEEERKRTKLEGIIMEKDYALITAQRDLEKKIEETLVLKDFLEQKTVSLEWAMVRIKEEEQKKHFFEATVQKLENCIKSMQLDLRKEQKQSKTELPRLGEAEQQLIMLHELVDSFALRESHCKKMYQRKCSNLQKAEEEVDLLGDEVDSLLSVLGKIYSVLNHYSPILQHYPGILDLVKLIKKEIMGHVDMEIKL